MLHIKNTKDKMASFVCLEKQPQSALKMLKYADNVQQYFGRENNKGLLFTMSWSGRLCSCSHRRCCLWNEVTLTKGVPPSPQACISRTPLPSCSSHLHSIVHWHWVLFCAGSSTGLTTEPLPIYSPSWRYSFLAAY